VLTNPLYIGAIVHKGTSHPGTHAAIVDQTTWEAVQAQLKSNTARRRNGAHAKAPSLLTGMLFDDVGNRLSPSHACKQGRRYRYYTSRADHPRWRLPALPLEQVVLEGMRRLLADRHRLVRGLGMRAVAAHDLQRALGRAEDVGEALLKAAAAEQRQLLLDLVSRIVVHQDRLEVVLRTAVLQTRLGLELDGRAESDGPAELVLDLPVAFRRRGAETKLIIADSGDASREPDPKLLTLLKQAQTWFAELSSGSEASVQSLAKRHGVDAGDVSRILPLALLAPDIAEAILDGRQPPELTAARLKRVTKLPLSWTRQRQILGFA
jgi:hypothetical protein